MSPIRVEAVYERRPLNLAADGPASVRWGVRAVWGDEPGSGRSGPVGHPEDPTMPHTDVAGRPEFSRTRRSAHRGPRELLAEQPPTLRYTSRGRAIPLIAAGPMDGSGLYLDITA